MRICVDPWRNLTAHVVVALVVDRSDGVCRTFEFAITASDCGTIQRRGILIATAVDGLTESRPTESFNSASIVTTDAIGVTGITVRPVFQRGHSASTNQFGIRSSQVSKPHNGSHHRAGGEKLAIT